MPKYVSIFKAGTSSHRGQPHPETKPGPVLEEEGLEPQPERLRRRTGFNVIKLFSFVTDNEAQ